MSGPAAKPRRWLAWVAFGVALAVSVGFVWPLFQVAWFQSHDMVGYPVRVIEYVAGWRAGALWPRWAPDLYGGYGSPFFNFYAPGLFIVSGALTLLGLSAVTALKLALVLFTTAGIVGMFGAVRGETGRLDAAAVAAAVFTFMAYHVTLIYVRGDLSEYCALCMEPLAIWGYRALGRVERRHLLPVGIGAAGAHPATLLIHTISGQWLTEFVFVIAGPMAVVAWRKKETWRVWALGTTFVGACGAVAIYALPALHDRPLVHIDRMVHGWLSTAHNLIDLQSLMHHGFFYPGVAVGLLPLAVIAACLWRRRLLLPLLGWTALALGCCLSMLRFAAPIWSWLPFGTYIQFPWRLLGFVSLFGALAWGAAWAALVPGRALVAWPLAVLAILALAHDGWRNRPPMAVMTAAEVPADTAAIAHAMHTTVVSDEYVPRTVPVLPRQPSGSFVLGHEGATVNLALRSGTGFKLELAASAGATVDLRSFYFPGWQVKTLHGPAKATVEAAPAGWVRLRLPEDGSYRVRVYFGLTPLTAAAAVTSLLSVLGLVLVLDRLRRHVGPT